MISCLYLLDSLNYFLEPKKNLKSRNENQPKPATNDKQTANNPKCGIVKEKTVNATKTKRTTKVKTDTITLTGFI